MGVRAQQGVWLSLALSCRPDALQPLSIEIDGPALPRVSIPLSGGAVAADDRSIVASDIDGDRVVWLDLEDDSLREISLPDGYAPMAVALEGDRAAVVLRSAAAVLVVERDPLQASVVPVCDEPRGIDTSGGITAVACAGGQIAVLDGDTPRILDLQTSLSERDLQDIWIDGGEALVSVLRAAVLIRVSLEDGAILERAELPVVPDIEGVPLRARGARRMVPSPDGRLVVLHQAHRLDEIDVQLAPELGAAYGTGACTAAARPVVTWIDPERPLGEGTASVRIDAVLPTDLAMWAEGDGAFPEPTPVISSVMSGASRGLSTAYPPSGLSDPSPYCVPRAQLLSSEGYVAGVALSGREGPVAVTRYPFSLLSLSGPLLSDPEGEAPPEGFALFHAPSPSGLTCASCHLDGREDGHTWQLSGFGPRRTQTLTGGILSSAPYHWDGLLLDLEALFHDTGVLRMGHPPASPEEVGALGEWLDGLPAPVPTGSSSAEGRALFEARCASCHEGPLSSNVDVGTGAALQAPSLAGVAARSPLMHDGCAETLEERFDPACGGSGHVPDLTEGEQAILIQELSSM